MVFLNPGFERLADVRLVDPGHRMVNLVVNETGEPVKIDLEIASIMSKYKFYENKIGDMFGTLIYSIFLPFSPIWTLPGILLTASDHIEIILEKGLSLRCPWHVKQSNPETLMLESISNSLCY